MGPASHGFRHLWCRRGRHLERTRQAAIVPSDLELIEATKEVVTDYLVLDSRSSNALLVTLSRLSR